MGYLVVRIDSDLLDSVDALIDAGAFESRSQAMGTGLGQLIDAVSRRQVGEAIVAGYQRRPQGDAFWSDQATGQMIADETW